MCKRLLMLFSLSAASWAQTATFTSDQIKAERQRLQQQLNDLDKLQGTATASEKSGIPPKREGTKRVGLLSPMVHFEGIDEAGATSFSDDIKVLAGSFFTVPNVELIPLTSRIPGASAVEARNKECDAVLQINLTRAVASSSSRFGAARMAVGMVPGLGSLSRSVAVAATIQTAAAAGAAASQVASQVKPKDILTLAYRLTDATSGADLLSGKEIGKAEKAQEDVLTPLIRKMSTDVYAKLAPAKP